jgi:hypothetical protein
MTGPAAAAAATAAGAATTRGPIVESDGLLVAAIVLAAMAVFETIGPPTTAFALRFVGEAGRAFGRQ